MENRNNSNNNNNASNANNASNRKKRLILIGGGGHCKSVLDSALAMNTFAEIVITDPQLRAGTEILGCKVVGNDNLLSELINTGEFTDAFVTVGSVGSIESVSLRKKLVRMAKQLGFKFPIIIDPTACVSQTASIGAGTFVGKHAVINAESVIGFHCIINSGAIIEHECSVGDFSHVSVGAVLCGDSHIGAECFIGAGSTVIQQINIGDRCIVGANSTVLNNLEDDMKVLGINSIKVTPPPPKIVENINYISAHAA